MRPLGGRRLAGREWAKVDPSRAYQFMGPSGKPSRLFFYDGPISQAVAFEKLCTMAKNLPSVYRSLFGQPDVAAADAHCTDGETYGHHHRHGEMALAYALDCVDRRSWRRSPTTGNFWRRIRRRMKRRLLRIRLGAVSTVLSGGAAFAVATRGVMDGIRNGGGLCARRWTGCAIGSRRALKTWQVPCSTIRGKRAMATSRLCLTQQSRDAREIRRAVLQARSNHG